MDRWQRRLTRLSKTCWRSAKWAISSPGGDAVFRVVLDDASTSSHECGGIRVLLVNDKPEVAKIRGDPASLSPPRQQPFRLRATLLQVEGFTRRVKRYP